MIRATVAATLSILLLISQATAVTADPLPSDLIDNAWLHSEDSAIVHVDPDLEIEGHGQTYLVESGETEIDVELVLSVDNNVTVDGDDLDLYDSFTIQLVGATFPAFSFAAPAVVDGTSDGDGDCTVTWNVVGLATGTLVGTIDCRGADGIDSSATVPLAIAGPATGSAIIAVDTTGEDFSSFMFVAEPGDEILVGMDPVTGGDAECPAPDFSTDAAAQGSIESALEAAFLAVDDADDVIVICDVTGEYTYLDSFKPYDLTEVGWADFYPSITVRAETDGGVALVGGGNQFFAVVGADLSLSGITFSEGAASLEIEGSPELLAPIAVVSGVLHLDGVNLFSNFGIYAGGATAVNGTLVANGVYAAENQSLIGGALSAINIPEDELFSGFAESANFRLSNTTLDHNCSATGGSAAFSYLVPETHIENVIVSGNTPCDLEFFGATPIFGGGAIYAVGGDISVIGGVFSDNEARGSGDDEDFGEDYGGAIGFDSCDLFGLPVDEVFLRLICGSPSLTVRGAVFEGNTASNGGAIAARGAEVSVERSRFGRDAQSSCGVTPKVGYANEASYGGGAIFAEDSILTVRSSQFYRNCGWGYADGGAIRTEGGASLVTNSAFAGNRAAEGGGAISAVDGDLRVTRSTFSANSAESGGAVYHASAAPAPYSTVLIEQNQFLGNLANSEWGQGGAVRISFANSKTTLVSNVFTANRAGQGGAVSLNDGFGEGFEDPLAYRWRVERNTFSNNVAAQNGGALHMALDNSGYVIPNGVRRNTFSRNSALAGGAVVVESDSGSERQILMRFQRALRDNRFAGNRATRARTTADIGVHFD